MNYVISVAMDQLDYLFCHFLHFFTICRHQWQTVISCQLPVNSLVVLDALSSFVYGHFKTVLNSSLDFFNFNIQHNPLHTNLSTIKLHFMTEIWSLLECVEECKIVDVFGRYGVPDIVEWTVYLWFCTPLEGIAVCLATAEHFIDYSGC